MRLPFAFFIATCWTFVQAPVALAQVSPLERVYAERVAMRALGQRCNLFDVGAKRALGGFTAQARGAALRAGVEQAQLSLIANQATLAANGKSCQDHAVQQEASRVIAAHRSWRTQMTGVYPGLARSWLVDRTGKDSWRSVQELGGGIRAGLVPSASGLSFALETPDVSASGARVFLRDANRIGAPRVGQRLTPPLRVGTTTYVAGTSRPADTRARIGVPPRAGTMLLFNDAATRAILQADPRDSFEVEIITRTGQISRGVVEVGDIVAAFAFAAEF
jgi:hypothetical protein